MGRGRFRGRNMVRIQFSDRNVVPGSTKYVDPNLKSGRATKTFWIYLDLCRNL